MTAPAVAQPLVPPRPRSEIARRVVVYVLLALVSLLFFVLFIWSISTSFIGTAAVQKRPLGGIPALKSWMCPWPTGPVKRSSQNTPNAAR